MFDRAQGGPTTTIQFGYVPVNMIVHDLPNDRKLKKTIVPEFNYTTHYSV
jgi:hypothetical protein